MTKGKQLMKSTPRATRFAVFTLALTAVLGTPVTAQSVDSSNTDAAINRSAPARPAAKSAAPARQAAAKPAAPARNNNAARPASNAARPAAARPAASRPAEASKSAAARPNTARPEAAHNTAHTNTAHSNTAHEARHEAAGRDNHGARSGEHAAKGNAPGRPAAKNAAYHHGENLHGGKRIPDARFHGSFGREHQFHIGHPVMIGGQASFQFGGLWFGLVDPWPAAWLYTDAVYVDFVNEEYVLVNVAHPEIQVAVSAGDAVTPSCNADPVVPVAPVVAAPVVAAGPVVVAVPAYPYLTWHYWRHYWR